MKNLQSWIVKNKVITAILLAAIVLSLGLILAFSQSEEESMQELAAQEQNSATGSEISGQNPSDIQSIAQLQGMDDEPLTSKESCSDAGGRCIDDDRDDASSCSKIYIDSIDCGTGRICCVEEKTTQSCLDLKGECLPLYLDDGVNNPSCQTKFQEHTDCPADEFCCVAPKQEADTTPTPTEGEEEGGKTDPAITTTPSPTPNTKNTCNKEVTCTECNTPCSEGDPRMCRTCSTEDKACSFREACGNNDTDPIYKSTCGKGDFIDESRQQREEGAQGYAHVKCTGTSVCTGGPNADGLYWCVQDTSPTDAPKEGCSIEYKEKAPCDTKCGSYLKCGADEEFQACAETSSCNLKTPTPTTSPVPPDDTGTDTGTLPAVQVTALPGTCGGHTKVYWTATTSDTSNGYWLYRGTTADFKPSKDNNIAGNINPNKTAESPYYDWLSEPGKTYYYRVIASGTGGSTKWSNAAQTLTSTACGSKATSPAQPISPEDPSNPGTPGGPGNPTPADWMTNCSASQGRGRGCACTQNTQCTNGWCNGGKCHYADTTTNCPATNKPQACVCETNAQCTSGWCNGGKCN